MRKQFIFLAVTLLLSGCATLSLQPKFEVAVSSLASPAASKEKTYVLWPGNKGVNVYDLQFQEYARDLRRVLARHGFVRAKNVATADVAILLSYGIGDPQTHQFSYSLPVYGQTGVSSSSTFGTATVNGDSGTYSGTTMYTPSYGITGYTAQSGSYTTFFRYARIDAYDLNVYRKSKKQIQIWQTTITSTGTSGDLRRVFPILMAAAAPYIASNTGKQVDVVLHESDPRVKAIEGKTGKKKAGQSKP